MDPTPKRDYVTGTSLIATVPLMSTGDKGRVAAAWTRVAVDCGCQDVYFCPAAGGIECPRHSGFDVCCDRLSEHVPAR
jgi:hypothetical protein